MHRKIKYEYKWLNKEGYSYTKNGETRNSETPAQSFVELRRDYRPSTEYTFEAIERSGGV